MRRLDLRSLDPSADEAAVVYSAAVPRAEIDVEQALAAVRPICEDVRERGTVAVLDAGERFDGVRPAQLRVPAEALATALDELDPAIRAGLEESIRRLRMTSEAELEHSIVSDVAPGAIVERRIVPMQRVGLYVPGGLAPLVSTVVMNAVPAQVAGVPGSRSRARPSRSSADSRTPRSWRPARCSASTRCTPPVARRRSRCSPTALRPRPVSTAVR
jgi:histidinol dehydrogenase